VLAEPAHLVRDGVGAVDDVVLRLAGHGDELDLLRADAGVARLDDHHLLLVVELVAGRDEVGDRLRLLEPVARWPERRPLRRGAGPEARQRHHGAERAEHEDAEHDGVGGREAALHTGRDG
jgi:hypothetical protein